MKSPDRVIVLTTEGTWDKILSQKSELLRRGYDISSSQLFRLALQVFDGRTVSDNDISVLMSEDRRRKKRKT